MDEAPKKLRVSAYAVQANVPVQKLAGMLAFPVIASDRKHVVLGEGGKWVVGYAFGALVFVGDVGDLETKALTAWSSLGEKASSETTTEDFTIVVDAAAAHAIEFDRLVVPEVTPAIVEIVALVVGQSVALEHIETEVDRILSKLQDHAESLRGRGTFRARKSELLRFIGVGLALSNRAVLTLSILDPPLSSWNDELLDRIQRGVRDAFGIEERYRALDHKLSKIQGSLELMVDLINTQRSLVLETTIVVLIVAEIILFFFEK